MMLYQITGGANMGQREVLNFLMKTPTKWYCTKDMLNMGFNKHSLNKVIRKLLMNGDIEERIEEYQVGRYTYRDRFIRMKRNE